MRSTVEKVSNVIKTGSLLYSLTRDWYCNILFLLKISLIYIIHVLRTHNLSYYPQIKYRLEEFNMVIHVFLLLLLLLYVIKIVHIQARALKCACIELSIQKVCMFLCRSLTMRADSRSWLFISINGWMRLFNIFLLSFLLLFMDNLF